MAEHTKGPWHIGNSGFSHGTQFEIRAMRGVDDLYITGIVWGDDGDEEYLPSYTEAEANAARIVACVNALEGYNPDAVRDVVEALRQADAALNSMAALVEAEWRDHDKAMTRHDNDVRAFRELRRNALARLGGAS